MQFLKKIYNLNLSDHHFFDTSLIIDQKSKVFILTYVRVLMTYIHHTCDFIDYLTQIERLVFSLHTKKKEEKKQKQTKVYIDRKRKTLTVQCYNQLSILSLYKEKERERKTLSASYYVSFDTRENTAARCGMAAAKRNGFQFNYIPGLGRR